MSNIKYLKNQKIKKKEMKDREMFPQKYYNKRRKIHMKEKEILERMKLTKEDEEFLERMRVAKEEEEFFIDEHGEKHYKKHYDFFLDEDDMITDENGNIKPEYIDIENADGVYTEEAFRKLEEKIAAKIAANQKK